VVEWVIYGMFQDGMALSCLSQPAEKACPAVLGGISVELSALDRQHHGEGTNWRVHLSFSA